MNEIKVSVLVYVLNDRMHIEKCVRSIMGQSLHEIEILLVDGGSTDGTLEIAQRLTREDERIRLIKSQSGVGVQFNTGLQEARGKYIGICESDDYILPDMYAQQYDIAERYKVDVLKANVWRFCEDDEGKEHSFLFSLSTNQALYDVLLEPQKDFCFLRLGVNGFWSGLYLREFLIKNSLRMNETEGASYQDITYSFLTELYAERAYVMSDAFYCYRMDNPNSSVNNPRKIFQLDTEYKLLKEQLKKRGIWEQVKEIYWGWKTISCLWFYDNLSDAMKEEYISMLYQNIRDEVESETYAGVELEQKGEELCYAAKLSFGKFTDFMRRMDVEWEETEVKIRELDLGRDIIIFGTGNLGALVNCYFEQNGKAVSAGIDNAPWKWDKIWNGLTVLSPEEGVKRYPKAVYMIANAAHGREMVQQLRRLGISKDHIMVCNNYDLFLKKILVKRIKNEIEK